MQIAQVLVGHELAQPDERGRDAIARALALRARARRRRSPACTPPTSPRSATRPRSRPVACSTIVADPSLTPGDCIVDVACCRIDARISAALDRAREVLDR